MILLRMIGIRLRRSCISLAFIISVFLYTGILMYAVFFDFQTTTYNYGLHYYLSYAYISNTQCMLLMITGLPTVLLFCDDWNGGFFYFIYCRCGLKKYVSSTIIACIIVSLLVVFLGESLFNAIILTKTDLIGDNDLDTLVVKYANGYLFAESKVISFYILHIFTKAAFVSTFNVMSLCLSVFYTNRLSAIVSSCTIYYYMTFILSSIKAPIYLNPTYIFSERRYLYSYLKTYVENEAICSIYPFIYCVIIIIIFEMIMIVGIRKKMN